MTTKHTKFLVYLVVVLAVLFGQVRAALAATEQINGTIRTITLETNTNTAVTTVLITLLENGAPQTIRVSIDGAIALGLVTLGGDGNPVINESILGQAIEIEPTTVILDEEDQHPVGNALATFFSDIPNLDYDKIMMAHNEGTGFGIIAQALWLTRKLDGDASLFLDIIYAKKNNDFSAFALGDGGSTPRNWGQFKKAVMEGRNGRPGIVMAENDHNGNNNAKGNDNQKDKSNNKDKDKNRPDKPTNGNGG